MFDKKKSDPFKKKRPILIVRNILLVAVIVFFVIFIVYFSGLIRKDCKTDLNCFNTKAYECKSAKVQTLVNDNTYEFVIFGPSGDTCVVKTTLVTMASGVPLDIKEKLEGKSMTCYIPRDMLKEQSVIEVKNVIDYCTGPLKESLYEVLLQKMYTLIVQNLGQIVADVKSQVIESPL